MGMAGRIGRVDDCLDKADAVRLIAAVDGYEETAAEDRAVRGLCCRITKAVRYVVSWC